MYVYTHKYIYIYIHISATALCATGVSGFKQFALRLLLSGFIGLLYIRAPPDPDGLGPAESPPPPGAPWCPFGDLWDPQGTPWTSPGSLRGPPGSPTAPQEAIKNTHRCDDLFFSRFFQFCVGSADPPTQKCYKNQRYFNDFENALLVSVSHFCSFRGSKDPSRTPFGEHTAPFWAPWTPPEISKRPPWSPQGAQRPPKSLPLLDPWPKKNTSG